jgi:hypothetical protein
MEFHDARSKEPHSLEARVQGAKQLLSKTHEETGGWADLEIFEKRARVYKMAASDNEAISSIPALIDPRSLPKHFGMSDIFQNRL